MKDIFVFIECKNKVPITESEGLLMLGKKLSHQCGDELIAVVFKSDIEENEMKKLTGCCDKVLIINNALSFYETDKYVSCLVNLCKEENPNVFIFYSSYLGKLLSSQISAEMNAGLTAECFELTMQGKQLVQKRPAHLGEVFADIITKKGHLQMATVKNIVCQEVEVPRVNTIFQTKEYNVYTSGIALLKYSNIIKKTVNDFQNSRIVIGVGAGVENCRTYQKINKLALQLGASIGYTRAVSEYSWYDERYLIGQSGREIDVPLYMAFGISGSVQHILGIKKCKNIFVVNKNNKASLFEIAKYGLVADVEEVVDYLLELTNELL